MRSGRLVPSVIWVLSISEPQPRVSYADRDETLGAPIPEDTTVMELPPETLLNLTSGCMSEGCLVPTESSI